MDLFLMSILLINVGVFNDRENFYRSKGYGSGYVSNPRNLY